MDKSLLLRTAAAGAVLVAVNVLAQPAPQAAIDAAPPPAEDRSSPGAVVLENSLVRAQRDQAFERSAASNGVASVGSGAVRATLRAQTDADLAQAREDQNLDLKGRGAGSLIKQ